MADPKNLRRCIVPFCTTRDLTGFSKFPVDPNKKEKWIEAFEIKFTVKPNDRVCHKHFCESDFGNHKNRKVLKPKAVPSLFLPCQTPVLR